MQLTLLVFLALIPAITTLQCYICNANENSKCERNDEQSLSGFKQSCNVVEPYCRKITQTVNGITSIVRSCGSKTGLKPCYKTAGVNNANVCSCNSDLCNNAPNFSRQQGMITILSSFVVLAISMIFLR